MNREIRRKGGFFLVDAPDFASAVAFFAIVVACALAFPVESGSAVLALTSFIPGFYRQLSRRHVLTSFTAGAYNWIKRINLIYVRVVLQGGGGGGGASDPYTNGGMGGKGGTAIKIIMAALLPLQLTLTVGGGGGAAAGGSGNPGGGGGTSSFGSFFSATGGGGGGGHNNAYGGDGVGVGGDENDFGPMESDWQYSLGGAGGVAPNGTPGNGQGGFARVEEIYAF